MTQADAPLDKLIASLKERAKELNCLYEVEKVLNQSDLPLDQAFQAVVEAIPPGWQYPDVCRAKIEHDGHSYIAVALAHDPRGGAWLIRLIGALDDLICQYGTPTPRVSWLDDTLR